EAGRSRCVRHRAPRAGVGAHHAASIHMSRAGRMRRVAILGHTGRPAVRRATRDLERRLARRGCQVRLEEHLGREVGRPAEALAALAGWCELLIALGGDGTALAGARAMAGKTGALLPVNFGGLGFLTVAESRELDIAVRAALAGDWPVERRGIVRATVSRVG